MQRILTQVDGRSVCIGVGEQTVSATIYLSVGMASTEQVDPDDVLKFADQRMYVQKQQWYADQKKQLTAEESPGGDDRIPPSR